MSFKTAIGLAPPPPTAEEELRRLRVKAAREYQLWHEIPQSRLVERAPSYLVDAETDVAYTVYRAPTFETGAVRPTLNALRELAFYVTDDDELVLLEPEGRSWSEIVARRSR